MGGAPEAADKWSVAVDIAAAEGVEEGALAVVGAEGFFGVGEGFGSGDFEEFFFYRGGIDGAARGLAFALAEDKRDGGEDEVEFKLLMAANGGAAGHRPASVSAVIAVATKRKRRIFLPCLRACFSKWGLRRIILSRW